MLIRASTRISYRQQCRSRSWRTGLLFAVTVASACGDERADTGSNASAVGEVLHPSAPNLEKEVSFETVPLSESLDSSLSPLERLAVQIGRRTLIDSFGALDGTPLEAFGEISQVSIDAASGRLLVIDGASRSVVVFDSALGHQYLLGGRVGSGPEDLHSPISARFVASDEVVILDRSFGGKRLRIGANGRAEFVNGMNALVPLNAGCVDKPGRIVTLDLRPRSPGAGLTSWTPAGEKSLSFGEGYVDSSSLVVSVMNEGVVACPDEGGTVAAKSWLPFVEAYDERGRQRWRTRLSPFTIGTHVLRVRGDGKSAIGLDPTRGDASYIRRLVPLEERCILVQVETLTEAGAKRGQPFGRRDTYLLDEESGIGVYLGDSIPAIAGIIGESLYAFENDPFPRLLRYRLSN